MSLIYLNLLSILVFHRMVFRVNTQSHGFTKIWLNSGLNGYPLTLWSHLRSESGNEETMLDLITHLFFRNGFYSIKLRPGFRIIVMNTNYCARLNIWSLYQSIDLSNHLKWLIEQLAMAEEDGDFVHIVGHIPPDNRECTQSWLYNYMAIVERYTETIVGQFFGYHLPTRVAPLT